MCVRVCVFGSKPQTTAQIAANQKSWQTRPTPSQPKYDHIIMYPAQPGFRFTPTRTRTELVQVFKLSSGSCEPELELYEFKLCASREPKPELSQIWLSSSSCTDQSRRNRTRTELVIIIVIVVAVVAAAAAVVVIVVVTVVVVVGGSISSSSSSSSSIISWWY